MSFDVTPHAFLDEAAAAAEIAAHGWYSRMAQIAPERNEPHYHPFDSTVYVLEGSMDFFEIETGIHHRCGPGTRVKDWGDNVHAEAHGGYRALVAFKEDPAQLFARPAKIVVGTSG